MSLTTRDETTQEEEHNYCTLLVLTVVKVGVVDASKRQDESHVQVDHVDVGKELLVRTGVLDTRHAGKLHRTRDGGGRRAEAGAGANSLTCKAMRDLDFDLTQDEYARVVRRGRREASTTGL